MGLTPCYQQITWPTRPLHMEQPLTGKTRVQELHLVLQLAMCIAHPGGGGFATIYFLLFFM